jgi:DNA adenine methylase
MSDYTKIEWADHTSCGMTPPTRPVLRWHGGKWKLAPWILSHFPRHRIYVEPFGGAAGVLLRKARSYAEIYNDLDDWVVNLFRVLRDDATAARLTELLRLTPFARGEFEIARELGEAAGDPVELARRLIIRSFMGFGSNAHNGRSTGFRANSSRTGTTPAEDWKNYPDTLPALIDRLRGVIIEHRDAIAVMAAHDGAETLHYVDPPYVPATRSPANKYDQKYRMYRHELDDAGHARLIDELRRLEGCVALSGYACPLYDERLSDWRRVETTSYADGARPRTEVLWLNPVCWQRLESERGADLFSSLPQLETVA